MKIVCIHQSADLYGSDRSFLQVVKFLKACGKFNLISVILPNTGPLVDELNLLGVNVIYMKLSLLSKTHLKKLHWGKILFPLLQLREKKKLLESYDIIYTNTSVILDFYVLAPFIKKRKIIHIREIPAPWLSKILSVLIARSKALVIFNSNSTKESFAPNENSIVLHNAFEGYTTSKREVDQTNFKSPLKILLIGRINTGKGHIFTIEALSKLYNLNFILKIVGSTSSGNEALLDCLKNKVSEFELNSKIEFSDFVLNTQEIYEWSDLVIVPSTRPESFGRIAIEAMSVGKPILAANHGGLSEIISHENNGFLFKPNDINSFNYYLKKYIEDRDLLSKHGKRSLSIFREDFSIEGFHKKLESVFFPETY